MIKMQISEVGEDKVLAPINMNSFIRAVFNPPCTVQSPAVKGSFKKYGCLGSTPERLAENPRCGACVSIMLKHSLDDFKVQTGLKSM